MVEAFERRLEEHWRTHIQLCDFRVKRALIFSLKKKNHIEIPVKAQLGLDQPEEDL